MMDSVITPIDGMDTLYPPRPMISRVPSWEKMHRRHVRDVDKRHIIDNSSRPISPSFGGEGALLQACPMFSRRPLIPKTTGCTVMVSSIESRLGNIQRVKSLSQLSQNGTFTTLSVELQCTFSRSTPQIESPKLLDENRSRFCVESTCLRYTQSDIDVEEVTPEKVDARSFDEFDIYDSPIFIQIHEVNNNDPQLVRSPSLKITDGPTQDNVDIEPLITPSRVQILKSNPNISECSKDMANFRSRSLNNIMEKDHTTGNVKIEIVSPEGVLTKSESFTPAFTSFILGEENGQTQKEFQVKHLKSIIFPCFSLIVFLADIGTDIQLAYSYRLDGEFDLFYITLVCIIVPSMIMAIVDVSWVWIDRDKFGLTKGYMVLRLLIGGLSLGRVVRAISHVHHVLKSRRDTYTTRHQSRALEEKRDCYMLDFISAFAESCPQLFVQLFLFYTFNLPFTFFRGASLLSSWISIAWAYASNYRCHREASSGQSDISLAGFVAFFMSVLSALAARVSCIVLFFVYFPHWIGSVLLLAHIVVVLVWIICQHPQLDGLTSSMLGRVLYYLFFAYVSLFCYINLRKEPSNTRMTVFYVLFYIENWLLAALTLWKILSVHNGSDNAFKLIMLPICMILHVVLLKSYYKCLHPTIGLCYKHGEELNV